MIEISFGKLVLLALVALIVLGPEKLPGAARTAGALLRRVRSGWDSVRAEVERELQIEEIRRTAREAAAHAEKAQAELDAATREVRQVAPSVADVGEPTAAPASAPAAESTAEAKPMDTLPPGSAPAMTEEVSAERLAEAVPFERERAPRHADAPEPQRRETPHGGV